jgi:uncharacterized membrane protein YphA (DoxX/SURF4 family)
MSISAKLRRAPTRVVTGAFILNSGIGKVRGDDDTAKAVHAMASNAFPVFEKVDPKLFLRALAGGEIALGAALLLPVVPAALAGAGLLAFSGSLLGLYWRTPHLHLENDPRPTHDGVAIAKDVWLAGIATSLLVDGLTAPVHDKRVEVGHQIKETAAVKTVQAAALTDAAKLASKRAYRDASRTARRTARRTASRAAATLPHR